MIIFIRIGDQIAEGVNEFAFFETTGDSFVRLNETQVWEDWSSFEEDYKSDWIYGYEQEYIAECKRLYDAEIAQGRASNSNSRDLVSKPVSAPQDFKDEYQRGHYNGYARGKIKGYEEGYYKGYEIGKEHQREAMQEGKVTYVRIT